MTEPGGLGQRWHFDPQNTNFLIADKLADRTRGGPDANMDLALGVRALAAHLANADEEPPPQLLDRANVTHEYFYDSAFWGDQGDTSDCEAFGTIHILADGPVTHKKRPLEDPFEFFKKVQAVDRREGRYYSDGATTLASAKAAQEAGYISGYYWGYTSADFITAIKHGPVGLGVDWLTGFDYPERSTGIIRATGSLRGGHFIDANGMNFKTGLIRLKNSWGRGWAKNGHCYLPIEDLEILIGRGIDMVWFDEVRDAA